MLMPSLKRGMLVTGRRKEEGFMKEVVFDLQFGWKQVKGTQIKRKQTLTGHQLQGSWGITLRARRHGHPSVHQAGEEAKDTVRWRLTYLRQVLERGHPAGSRENVEGV